MQSFLLWSTPNSSNAGTVVCPTSFAASQETCNEVRHFCHWSSATPSLSETTTSAGQCGGPALPSGELSSFGPIQLHLQGCISHLQLLKALCWAQGTTIIQFRCDKIHCPCAKASPEPSAKASPEPKTVIPQERVPAFSGTASLTVP